MFFFENRRIRFSCEGIKKKQEIFFFPFLYTPLRNRRTLTVTAAVPGKTVKTRWEGVIHNVYYFFQHFRGDKKHLEKADDEKCLKEMTNRSRGMLNFFFLYSPAPLDICPPHYQADFLNFYNILGLSKFTRIQTKKRCVTDVSTNPPKKIVDWWKLLFFSGNSYTTSFFKRTRRSIFLFNYSFFLSFSYT